MSEQSKFLVQARWALNSLIGGADLDKVRRHLPQFEIEADAKGFSVKLREAEKTTTTPPPSTPPAGGTSSELEIARAAAAAAANGQGSTATLAPVE